MYTILGLLVISNTAGSYIVTKVAGHLNHVSSSNDQIGQFAIRRTDNNY